MGNRGYDTLYSPIFIKKIDMAKKKIEKEIIVEAMDGESALSTYKRSSLSAPKKQRQIIEYPFPSALVNQLGVDGVKICTNTLITGFEDTGKTTLLFHLAIEAQKRGDLPVFCITEQKFSFEHLQEMGFKCEKTEIVDEDTGELINMWDGDFIYKDDFLHSEELFDFLDKIMNDQKDQKLKRNVLFLVDSINSIPPEVVFLGGGGNQHLARVLSERFGMAFSRRITNTRYEEKYKYYATFVAVAQGYLGQGTQPTIQIRGGGALKYNAGDIILFGGKQTGSSKFIEMTVKGRDLKIGKKVRVQYLKNHSQGVTVEGEIAIMPHGIINIEEIEDYKKKHKSYFETKVSKFQTMIDEE